MRRLLTPLCLLSTGTHCSDRQAALACSTTVSLLTHSAEGGIVDIHATGGAVGASAPRGARLALRQTGWRKDSGHHGGCCSIIELAKRGTAVACGAHPLGPALSPLARPPMVRPAGKQAPGALNAQKKLRNAFQSRRVRRRAAGNTQSARDAARQAGSR
jgi:hypothetical protein